MRHRPVIHGGGRERESSGGAVLVFCLFLLYGQHDRERASLVLVTIYIYKSIILYYIIL